MKEIMMRLTAGGKKPLYEQIYEYIKGEIYKGELSQGEKLPSTRLLAAQLGISRSTAELAYDQLRSEGYIEAKPCKGYFVCRVDELYHLDAGEPLGEETKTRSQPHYICDFSPDGIDMRYFPYNAWRKITKNILIDDRSELFSLGDPMGEMELRTAIARYLHRSRMVNCTAEQIVVGAGNDYLLMLLSRLFPEGQRIAMENPTYKRAYRILKSMGNEMRLVGTDESGMDVNDLRRTGAGIVYCMPAHQYPLGIVMPVGRRMELLKWADGGEDRYLIEDDYDSEFRYRTKPIPALQSLDRNGRVIYIGTFSKAIAPAIRVSYMVLPRKLLNRFREKCLYFSSTVSRIDQATLNEFIRDGYFERHLNKMRKVYKDKHDLLLGALKSLSGGIGLSGENAGLHVLIDWKGASADRILKEAGKRGVRLYSIADACIQETGRKGRLSPPPLRPSLENVTIAGFGGLTEDAILNGVEIIRDIL